MRKRPRSSLAAECSSVGVSSKLHAQEFTMPRRLEKQGGWTQACWVLCWIFRMFS